MPMYLDIPSVSLTASELEGGNTSKITEVWVTVDEKSVGVWELPARVPVIGEGTHTIGVTAGIRRNGAFDDRERYPYYTTWRTSVEFVPGSSMPVTPEVRYQGATIWTERFNDAGSQLVANTQSDTTLILYSPSERPDVVLDNSQCGGFVLDTQNDFVALQTEQNFLGATGPVYMEMDYSTDIELTIGYTYEADGNARYEPWVILVPTASAGSVVWNKVYIDLATFFNTPGISGRDIYIAAQLPSGRTLAAGYFDNLKIVRPAS